MTLLDVEMKEQCVKPKSGNFRMESTALTHFIMAFFSTHIILIYFERFLPKSSVVLVVTFFTVQQLVMGYKKMDFDLNYFILTVGKGALLPLG